MHIGNADAGAERRTNRLFRDDRLGARDLGLRDVPLGARPIDFLLRDCAVLAQALQTGEAGLRRRRLRLLRLQTRLLDGPVAHDEDGPRVDNAAGNERHVVHRSGELRAQRDRTQRQDGSDRRGRRTVQLLPSDGGGDGLDWLRLMAGRHCGGTCCCGLPCGEGQGDDQYDRDQNRRCPSALSENASTHIQRPPGRCYVWWLAVSADCRLTALEFDTRRAVTAVSAGVRRAPGKYRMLEQRVDNTNCSGRLDSVCWEQMLQYGCSQACETAIPFYRGSGGHRRHERGRSRTADVWGDLRTPWDHGRPVRDPAHAAGGASDWPRPGRGGQRLRSSRARRHADDRPPRATGTRPPHARQRGPALLPRDHHERRSEIVGSYRSGDRRRGAPAYAVPQRGAAPATRPPDGNPRRLSKVVARNNACCAHVLAASLVVPIFTVFGG